MTVCFAPCPVVFDLEGTLVDTAPDVHAAVNAVLRDRNVRPLPIDTIRGLLGGGVDDLWMRILRRTGMPLAQHGDLVAAFMVRYHSATSLTRLFPGVLDALGNLADRGHRLGICSNKPLGSILDALDKFGLSGAFDHLVGSDSLAEQKPDPAPLRAAFAGLGADPDRIDGLYIGDDETDAACAAAVPIPFFLFTRGYRQVPIADLSHHRSFADFALLPPLIEAFGEESHA